MNYSISRDVILDTKYSFLRFLQGYFSLHKKYTWTQDVRNTKIIIVDKNALDLGVALLRPAIILNRNGAGWTYTTGTQNAINTNRNQIHTLNGNVPNAITGKDLIYSDLLTGSLSFSVLSKNGVVAEHLASTLFTILTGFKEELRKNGIHKITNLSIGPEQLIKQNAEHELISVTVSLTYYIQSTISKEDTFNNVEVYVATEEISEGFDYEVTSEGSAITLVRETPSEAPTISYIDAVTLEEVNNVTLIEVVGEPTVFTVPDNGKILGFYTILDTVEQDIIISE